MKKSMYNKEDKNSLLECAKSSIKYGLNHQNPISIGERYHTNKLFEIRACFVTITLNNCLRGCIGSLNASKPLIEDIASNAYAAAFEDPRFSKLSKDEFDNICIEISILSVPEEINFYDEDDLLTQLRIDLDGVIFNYKQYRSTYLPTVWSALPTPELFMNSLKEKAGLNATFWSPEIRCYRYTTQIIK